MECIRHNNMKTMRRKKSQTMVKRHKTKRQGYTLHRGWQKKTYQVPTFDTYISHLDLIISNYNHFKESLE